MYLTVYTSSFNGDIWMSGYLSGFMHNTLVFKKNNNLQVDTPPPTSYIYITFSVYYDMTVFSDYYSVWFSVERLRDEGLTRTFIST